MHKKRQKKEYDMKLNQHHYDTGDLVYEVNSATKVGCSQKLEKIWNGPFLITKVLSPILYVIQGRRRSKVVHHDRIKQCSDRDIPLWMTRMRNNFLAGEEWVDDVELPEEGFNLDKLFGNHEVEHVTDEDSDEVLGNENVVSATPKITTRGRRVKVPAHLSHDYVM